MWLICTFLVLCVLPYWHPVNSDSIEYFNRDEFCLDKEPNEMAYVFFEEKVDWYDAYITCQRKGMELLKFTTAMNKLDFGSWYGIYGHFKFRFLPRVIWISGKRPLGSLEDDDIVWVPENIRINDTELNKSKSHFKGDCLIWVNRLGTPEWRTRYCRDQYPFCCQTIC